MKFESTQCCQYCIGGTFDGQNFHEVLDYKATFMKIKISFVKQM